MVTEKERKKIKGLWESESFWGAFTGSTTFRKALESEGIHVSQKELLGILKTIPSYVNKAKRVKVGRSRPYRVTTVDQLWEVDMANVDLKIKRQSDFKSFMVVVDVFSRRIWTRPLTNEKKESLIEQFESIFKDYGKVPVQIQGDMQFHPLKSFFESKNILFRTTARRMKAAIAENSIWLIKKRLGHALATKTQTGLDWTHFLPKITEAVNKTPREKLGNLRPFDIDRPEMDPIVRASSSLPKLVNWREQMKNKEAYDKSDGLKEGDWVLYDYKKMKGFEKYHHNKVLYF